MTYRELTFRLTIDYKAKERKKLDDVIELK